MCVFGRGEGVWGFGGVEGGGLGREGISGG